MADMSREFDRLYATTGRPSIPPERLLRAIAAGLLLDPQRAVADGAAGLQPAVSLVRGPDDGRSGLGRDDVHEESRPVAQSRDRPELLPARRRARPRTDVR